MLNVFINGLAHIRLTFITYGEKRSVLKLLILRGILERDSYHIIRLILKHIRCSQRCCLERRIGVARATINFINTSTDD